ncbi:MAG: VWA domain-containing protein [Deltaproteobacteria bacterium]|nr:VWA domain-containing protein [Deltaproteobacteria bacterium]
MKALIIGLLLGFLGFGCQDYNYEQLSPADFNTKHQLSTVELSPEVDVLFVIDNSGSMAGEQQQLANSFEIFANRLDALFGADMLHMAVVTTGVESPGCPSCDEFIKASCMNETGESGAFQDRLGRIASYDENLDTYIFEFRSEPACGIIENSAEQSCFFDADSQEGTVFVGINGCGYERGLAPIRMALSDLQNQHVGFLRPDATLVVVLISDEDDCGEVGDISEGIPGAGGRMCYYAAKGVGPGGTTSHPDDPTSKPYRLTSVDETYKFLMELKGNRAGLVKFAAIVGISDPEHPEDTRIEYEDPGNPSSNILPACVTPACTGRYCQAYPGTRYIELAKKFGNQFGFVDTICQADFSGTMEKIATWVGCPEDFQLQATIEDAALANILVNDLPVPRYSCTNITDSVLACAGPGETDDCPTGSECKETWIYDDQAGEHGTISFAEHFDPCANRDEGQLRIDLLYVTP